jgi:arginine-tRNA-protein transferase
MIDYRKFMGEGFCRDTFVFFKPICEGCSACIPMRIEVDKFCPSKSQKRVLKKNKDIKITVKRAGLPTPDDEVLYAKYNKLRHPERNKDEYLQGIFNLHMGYPYSYEMRFYIEDRLIGVSILDESMESISSAYFYWDPDFEDRSLGVYSMIQEIFYAKLSNKKYLYLGFYIRDISNMEYKSRFRPAQLYINSEWVDFYPDFDKL